MGWSAAGRLPAEFWPVCRELPVKFRAGFQEIPAKMPKRKKSIKKSRKPLDTYSGKRGRGRPPKMYASEVSGRAYNYRLIFDQIWDTAGEQLLSAKTEEEVIQAFEDIVYERDFAPIASLILQVLRDPDFPKRDRQAQVNFLADSLAARGAVTPRTSRDICERERAKQRRKSPHKILRHEFYVECSCGYKGPAHDNACRKCGAEIPPSLGGLVMP